MDVLEQTASFNSRLTLERKMRLPFLDSQTGVAQRHTNLFHPYRHRQPGLYIVIFILNSKGHRRCHSVFYYTPYLVAKSVCTI